MSLIGGWNSLGDVRALEALAKRRDLADMGRLALKLIRNIEYLNGCVIRGRGRDIDSNYPAKNIFEYIKELEAENKTAFDAGCKAGMERAADIADTTYGTGAGIASVIRKEIEE